MEEILASIKRVIAEDGRIAAAKTPRAKTAEAAEPAPPSPPVDEDVLELDDPVSENGPGLMSDGATAASRQRLASLSALRQRAETPPEPGALEAAVREMLRPMLKAWLDENLPEIVESLVTREIARITGRSL